MTVRTTLLMALALAAGAGTPASADPPGDWGPLLEQAVPDPYVFEDEGYYYITGTSMTGYCGKSLESEAMRAFEVSLDYGPLGGPFQHWGLKFYRHTDGSYHAYATVHFGQFRTAVAHFLPAPGSVWAPGRPITSWTFDRLMAGDRECRTGCAYDVGLERDEDGTLYLFYNYSPALGKDVLIRAQRLTGPGTPDPDSAPRVVLEPEGYRSEDRNPGFIQITEATNLTRIGDTWVLLYSVGDFALHGGTSNYKLGVAYSKNLIPPDGKTYEKVLLPDPENLWKNQGRDGREIGYLLQSEIPGWPNYCASYVRGPGLGNIVIEDGAATLVFHGYRPGNDSPNAGQRYVWKAPLCVNIGNGAPARDWLTVLLPGTGEDAG